MHEQCKLESEYHPKYDNCYLVFYKLLEQLYQTLVYTCMILDLTPSIVEDLHKKGYVFFIDKDNVSNDQHMFTPIKTPLDEYEVNKEEDAILGLEEATKLSFDELSKHKVIMPDVD